MRSALCEVDRPEVDFFSLSCDALRLQFRVEGHPCGRVRQERDAFVSLGRMSGCLVFLFCCVVSLYFDYFFKFSFSCSSFVGYFV
jgi:hypothetical protein